MGKRKSRERKRKMNDDPTFMNLKVYYKLPKMQAVKEDWVCSSLKELIEALERDGITDKSVEFMYVHYTPVSNNMNETIELVAVDNRPTSTGTNVVPFVKKDKPHIKLTAAAVEQKPTMHYSYLYSAAQV